MTKEKLPFGVEGKSGDSAGRLRGLLRKVRALVSEVGDLARGVLAEGDGVSARRSAGYRPVQEEPLAWSRDEVSSVQPVDGKKGASEPGPGSESSPFREDMPTLGTGESVDGFFGSLPPEKKRDSCPDV